MSSTLSTRRSQRQPLSCLNCARQKIRCSKTIPCTACIDRGHDATCHRESVEVTSTKKRRRIRRLERLDPEDEQHASTPAQAASPPSFAHPRDFTNGPTSSTPHQSPVTPASFSQSRVPHIQNDAVVTLEFLSHGRQSILRMGDAAQSPYNATTPTQRVNEAFSWEILVTIEQARLILAFHQEHLAWMHNVVHMPTFRDQLESKISTGPSEKSWLALYYALICTTAYHADDSELLDMGISTSNSFVQLLYNRSVQSLHEANFMAKHTLFSVQTICVLLQVAYNLDQGDLFSVLLSAAIKISQSLGLNRLGPDREAFCCPEGTTIAQYLVEREVKKRTWWFLVRQDWLQIPFQNTFVIHANQFNTPIPHNCFDNEERMIEDGKVVVQPSTTYTQNSYSNEIHKVAVVIWKHQEKMCAAGHPGTSREGLMRLYEQTLWADKEIKQRYKEMPSFFQDVKLASGGDLPHVKKISSIQLLSTAHKIHTIHRHFQLQSFRDPMFSYTQQSCLAISQKCIKDVEAWSPDSATRMALKMWTVITHIITCCVNLTFASIFRNENLMLYDGAEMQRLASVGREAMRPAEEWSSIARRGGALLDALFEIENSLCYSSEAQFKMEDIVRRVMQVDANFQGDLALAPELGDTFFDLPLDWDFN